MDGVNNKSTELRDLRGHYALITGATGGVGQACAEVFADAGMHLILAGRDRAKLEQLRASLQQQRPVEVQIVAGDIGDPALAEQAFAQFKSSGIDRVTVLINNAGVIVRATAEKTSNSEWQHLMNTNLNGLFYFSRAYAQQTHSDGAIINISSTCGSVGSAGLAAYCASKGAVNQLTRAMALELADRGVNVNAVAPGAIDSPMLFKEHSTAALSNSVVARNEASILQGRIAHPMEVARAVLFLSQQRHITGTILPIDGGYTSA